MGVSQTAGQRQAVGDLKRSIAIDSPGLPVLRGVLNLIGIAVKLRCRQGQEETEVTEDNKLQVVVIHRCATDKIEGAVVLAGYSQFQLIGLAGGISTRIV